MLNKKGIHYVDWVISMGTFIIAVIAILVYLKPGVKLEYNRETLLFIAETNFFNETQWYVRDIPLFIRRLQQNYPTQSGTQDASVDIDFSPGFSFNVDNIPAGITQENDKFKCTVGLCQNKTVDLIFYPNNPLNKDLPLMKASCIPPDDNYCKAELGSSEIIEGLNAFKLNALSQRNYDSLKIDWKYPLSRDFAVYIDGTKITSNPEPPQQANVFAKEIKYWKVDNHGIRTAVKISIRAW